MATERDIRLGLRVEGLDKTRQDFKAVGEAVKAIGPESAAAADAIVSGFKSIESASDSAANKIAEGRKVSQSQLDGLILKYDELRDTIESSFPDGAPAELVEALQKAEDRISATIKAADEMPAKMQAARDAFRGVVPAAEELENAVKAIGPAADDAKQSIEEVAGAVHGPQTSLSAAFSRVENNLESFRSELNETGDVGKGEIEKITKAQALLEMEIRKSVGTYDQLDAKSKAAYDKIQQEADEARKVVVELEKANERVEASLDGQIKGFTGFGDAIQQMGGKAGVAAAQMGVLTAAFQQGWQAGQQFNQVIKTDMSEWDEQVELLGMRFKTTFEGIADIVIENGNLLKAVFTGDWDAFKLASQGLREGLDKTVEGFSKSNDELRAHRDALREARVAAAEKAAEAARLAAEEGKASEASDKLAEAQRNLTAAQRAALEALGQSTGATAEAAQAQDEWTSKVVGHIEIQADGTKKYVIGQESVRNATKETQGVVEAAIERTKDATVTTEEQSTVTEKATESIRKMADEWKAIDFSSFVKNLGEVDTLLKSIAASAVTAAKAINDFAEAGNDGITVSRSDGSDIQPGTLSGGTFRNPGDNRDINL